MSDTEQATCYWCHTLVGGDTIEVEHDDEVRHFHRSCVLAIAQSLREQGLAL